MGKIKKLRNRAVRGTASQHSAHLTEEVVGYEAEKISSKKIKERYYQVILLLYWLYHLLVIYRLVAGLVFNDNHSVYSNTCFQIMNPFIKFFI